MSFEKIRKIASSAMDHITRTNRYHNRIAMATMDLAAESASASENGGGGAVAKAREVAIYAGRLTKTGLIGTGKIVGVALIGYTAQQTIFFGKKEKAVDQTRTELHTMTKEVKTIVSRNGDKITALTVEVEKVHDNMKALAVEVEKVRDKMKPCEPTS